MEQLIEQFLEHLRYERNVSSHTLRNYSSDLEQFLDFLAPADPATGKRSTPEVSAIDHLTIREWLASLHTAQKKKASIARKLAALRTFFQFLVREGVLELNPAKLVATRSSRRNFRSICRSKRLSGLSNLLIRRPILVNVIVRCWS